MNKKAIWAIIGLMSAAMIGIILLQLYWINFNIKLNEQRFDRDVKDAITQVAKRLEVWEDNATYDNALNLRANTPASYSSASIRKSFRPGEVLSEISMTQNFRNVQLTPASVNPLTINDSGFSQFQDKMEYQKVQKMLNLHPLEERINLDVLHGLLEQELKKKRGIKTNFQYGVFSHQKGSFVINNGSYAVINETSSSIENVDNDLYNSSYQTELFSNSYALESPGLLMVHFPNRTSVIWSSSWKTLLASIIFTGLILLNGLQTSFVKKISE